MNDITLQVDEQQSISLTTNNPETISLNMDGTIIYENNYSKLTNKPKINNVELGWNNWKKHIQ